MSTLSFPTDPVILGATAIQGTIFVPVPADYTELFYSSATRRAKSMMARAKSDILKYFPRTEGAADEWRFFGRQDLIATSGKANLIGIRAFQEREEYSYYSATAGKDVDSEIIFQTNRVVHWLFGDITYPNSDEQSIPYRAADFSLTRIIDPTGAVVLDDASDGTVKIALETLGFHLEAQAADYPTLDPFNRIVSGGQPLA